MIKKHSLFFFDNCSKYQLMPCLRSNSSVNAKSSSSLTSGIGAFINVLALTKFVEALFAAECVEDFLSNVGVSIFIFFVCSSKSSAVDRFTPVFDDVGFDIIRNLTIVFITSTHVKVFSINRYEWSKIIENTWEEF